MPRGDALGIKDGLYGFTGGVDPGRGLPRPFDHPNRSRHRTRAIFRRGTRGTGFKTIDARDSGGLGEREKFGIGRSRLG